MSDLDAVLAELVAREPLFHRTELGTDRATFEAMTAEDFWEVGASGRAYDRETVWGVLEPRYAAGEPDPWEATDFRCRELAPDVYLLTYQLHQFDDRPTRRATIWERADTGWRIVYHQGTVIS